MTWKYKILEQEVSEGTDSFVVRLNEAANEGWEAVNVAVCSSADFFVILLKKPDSN